MTDFDSADRMKIRNLEQNILLLRELKEAYKKRIRVLKAELISLKNSVEFEIHKEKESTQLKILAQDLAKQEHKKNLQLIKRSHGFIVLIGLVVVALFIGYSQYENYFVLKTASNISTNFKTQNLIQNLDGILISTWVSWNIPSDRILYVDIVNNAGISEHNINALKDAILSERTLQLDNSLLNEGQKGTTSTYYVGWRGALEEASKSNTHIYIPERFDVSESNSQTGDIIVNLSSETNPEGYTGITRSIADSHQILRSTITIYGARNLSYDQLETIMRHEFGHALGIAYSSDPNDVMHLTIQTEYPYISSCDIHAIDSLYNGSQSSEVVCK